MAIEVSVTDNKENTYKVTEIQYGGARTGGGNRGFYITPTKQSGNRAEYDIMPNPHGNPSYNRKRLQPSLYATAATTVANAASDASPFKWPSSVNYEWEGVDYTSKLQ